MLSSLVDRIVKMHPRCVRLVAGAGWGKTAFTRALMKAMPETSAVVHCRGMETVRELDDAIAAALREVGIETPADDPLAGWRRAGPRCVLIVDEGAVLLNIEHAVDRIRTLLRQTPDDRMVVLSSRVELPVVWSSYFAPHEMVTLTGADLGIGAAELGALFGAVEHAPELDERILTVSQGWPIAVLLFIRLAAIGTLDVTLDALGDSSALGDLHAYVEAEIFAGLSDAELETFCAICAIGGGTLDEIIITVGRRVDEDIARLASPFCSLVMRHGDAYAPLLLAGTAAEATQRERIHDILQNASERFFLAGRHVRAAELALRERDSALACRCLDAVSAPVPAFVPSKAYVRAALEIDVAVLARSQNVLTILLAGRVGRDVTAALAAKIGAFWDGFSQEDEDHRLRTTLRIARAYLLRSAGQFEAADRSAKGAERDVAFLTKGSPIVTAMYCIRSVLALDFQRVAEAAACWALSGESFDATQTFFAVDRLESDVLGGLATMSVPALAAAFAATVAELQRWNDETGRIETAVFEGVAHFYTVGRLPDAVAAPSAGDHVEPVGANSFDAVYASETSPIPIDTSAKFTVLLKIDAALKQSDRGVAIELVRNAVALADTLGLPLHRVVTRVVWAALDEDMRPSLIEEALTIAPTEVMRARVIEFRDGTVAADSIFKPFLTNLQSANITGTAMFRVEIMRAIVLNRGAVVRLRERELELLVLLALAPKGLSRDVLTDRLWPDQDEHDAAGSLRSTLHRLRRHFGDHAVILRDGLQYRLSGDVAIDIIEAEALLNALRGKNVQISGFERRSLEREFEALAVRIPQTYERWSWFQEMETRLVDLRHDLGMLLAREDFQKEHFVSAQRWAEQLVNLEPLDEAAAELLFHAILRTRGNAEASRWLRRYRDLLAREYGLEPSFEFDRAFEAHTEQAAG